MSFLTGLFANKSVQDMALGTLKKTMRESGNKFVVIDLMDSGELDIQMFKAEDQPVVVSLKQQQQAREIFADQNTRITELERLAGLDKQIIEQLESVITSRDKEVKELQLIIDGLNHSNTLKRDNDDNNHEPGEPNPTIGERY